MLARLPVEAMRPGATIAGASPHAPNFWGKQISSGKCRHVMVDAGSLLHLRQVCAAPHSTGCLTLWARTESVFGQPCRVALAVLRPGSGVLSVPLRARFSEAVPLRLSVSGGTGALHVSGFVEPARACVDHVRFDLDASAAAADEEGELRAIDDELVAWIAASTMHEAESKPAIDRQHSYLGSSRNLLQAGSVLASSSNPAERGDSRSDLARNAIGAYRKQEVKAPKMPARQQSFGGD